MSEAERPEDLDELGIARAIRDGSLASPQLYHNMALFALRITGTGTAYRKSLKEYVWRDPNLYLNNDFLARCNGLPVIVEHPEGDSLNSAEFQDRVIGSIMLPYVKGDEVWGVARIYDKTAIMMMRNHQLSTSPAVVFRDPDVNTTTKLEDGATLLIEGHASLLDHLAICEQGVWDKGGSPAGVKLSNKDKTMTEEEQKAAEVAAATAKKDADQSRRDAEAGEKLDRILTHVDSFGSRLDALEKFRKDAEVEGRDDPAKNLSPPSDDKLKEKLNEPGNERQDTKKDQEPTEEEKKKLAEEEKMKMERDDAARKDADDTRRRLDAFEKQLPKQVSDADYAAMADAQAKADKVHSAFGDSAPRPLQGEDLLSYRRRLATGLKKHSDDWKDEDLSKVPEGVLAIAERKVYKDAMNVALHPVDLPAGMLREIITQDTTGRRISTFAGEPRAWMQQFCATRRRLAGIRNHSNGSR